MEGRCTCGAVRYRLASPPLFTHCCHCRWCQRQTGSACVVNAMIETDRIQLLTGQPEMISIPSPSGMGQNGCPLPYLQDRPLELLHYRRRQNPLRPRLHLG
jgi:hypothetical protein